MVMLSRHVRSRVIVTVQLPTSVRNHPIIIYTIINVIRPRLAIKNNNNNNNAIGRIKSMKWRTRRIKISGIWSGFYFNISECFVVDMMDGGWVISLGRMIRQDLDERELWMITFESNICYICNPSYWFELSLLWKIWDSLIIVSWKDRLGPNVCCLLCLVFMV